MGDFKVRKIKNAKDSNRMYQQALQDIAVFEQMLKDDVFDNGEPKIGAEQEMCIVDNNLEPSRNALEILNVIDDEHYTNELALFNLEINLDPLPLKGNCFSEMEGELLCLLSQGTEVARYYKDDIALTGILPTLKYRHLQFNYMTPEHRYKTISDKLSELRGKDFDIHVQGVDEVIMSLGSVLFEACNTSFQLHLQIAPKDFVNQHNWAQMIAGPVLSACVNSPMLFGNELWAETRIALFKQSLDTRSADKLYRKKLPRVYFGKDWLRNSPADLWKSDITRFPLLVTSDDFEDAELVYKNGGIPNLRGIRLHNGTTYTWNRMCYGFSKKQPHLRIECRYLPSGPTPVDEIANFAFWIGLMNAEPPKGIEFWKDIDFRTVKNNFIKGARYGLNTVFDWFGQNMSAKELILNELLPLAKAGLAKRNIAQEDIDKYLGIIENRVQAEVTGSSWQVENFRILADKYGQSIAQKELVRHMIQYQDKNIPIHQWENINVATSLILNDSPTVEQFMSTDILTTNEADSIDLVKNILKWYNIHHLPVEDYDGNLVGLITDGLIERLEFDQPELCRYAGDVMLSDFVTINVKENIEKAISLMELHQLSGLPVVYKEKLVGILTRRDLEKLPVDFSSDVAQR